MCLRIFISLKQCISFENYKIMVGRLLVMSQESNMIADDVVVVVVVKSVSSVQAFVTPRTAACQAFLSFTISQSLLKLISIESVMPSSHLILCHPFSSFLQSFTATGSFPVSWLFPSGGQKIGAQLQQQSFQ